MVFDMRWFIILSIVLIAVDFKFGKENSLAHGVAFRRSRAVRRTVNKFIDYMCWLIFAAVLGQAFGEPYGINRLVISATVMIVACCIEVDSITQNYFESRGLDGVSLKGFLVSLAKKKDKDIGEALDDAIRNTNKTKKCDIDDQDF